MSERKLSSYSLDEVLAILRDYMGDVPAEVDTLMAAEAVNRLIELDDQTRKYALSALSAFICRECGADARFSQCYCQADD